MNAVAAPAGLLELQIQAADTVVCASRSLCFPPSDRRCGPGATVVNLDAAASSSRRRHGLRWTAPGENRGWGTQGDRSGLRRVAVPQGYPRSSAATLPLPLDREASARGGVGGRGLLASSTRLPVARKDDGRRHAVPATASLQRPRHARASPTRRSRPRRPTRRSRSAMVSARLDCCGRTCGIFVRRRRVDRRCRRCRRTCVATCGGARFPRQSIHVHVCTRARVL